MTSLASQLAKLKNAPSVAQGVERDYSSLLFEKSEAASLDREQAYKLGKSSRIVLTLKAQF